MLCRLSYRGLYLDFVWYIYISAQYLFLIGMINCADYGIILADDIYSYRSGFEECLRKRGFRIYQSVEDGRKLYEVCRTGIYYWKNPERMVTLSDTDMPIMDGDEACRKLLGEEKRFRRVLMMGMSDNPDNERHWEGVGVWQTFILKAPGIEDPESERNIAARLYDNLSFIESNPPWFRLPDGKSWRYRRSIRE